MFSVVVPVYNKFPHLDRSIQSVLNQTFEDFELLLIDDASTDGSHDKLMSYKDPRVRILRRSKPGAGGYAARNLGIKEAKYKWISFLDADDEWSKDYLKNVYEIINANASVELVTVAWEKTIVEKPFQDNLTSFMTFNIQDYLENYKLAWTGAVNVKKDLIKKAGLFPSDNVKCKRGGDVDTWIRCLWISKSNIHIKNVLAYYYQDTVNQVTNPKVNATNYFCAYNSLICILEQTTDRKKRRVIQKYINMKLLHILERNRRFDFSVLKKMYIDKYSLPRIFLLLIRSVFS